MGTLPFSLIFKLALISFIVSYTLSFVVSEVVIPESTVPFHNLIPRFKIPPGHLLRYRIPQWEVLYFLKYGIVPFIFYNPNFNRTNFISQVHKFKMYFGETEHLPKATDNPVNDDESFREFLRIHGYPNYDQLPENAFSENKKVAEEILRAAVGNTGGESGTKLTPLDLLLDNLDGVKEESNNYTSVLKKSNRIGLTFWNTFINRYPHSWKYSKTLLRHHDLPSFENPNIRQQSRAINPLQVRRDVSLRNVNYDSGGTGDDDASSAGGGNLRRGEKNFQTQGW